MAKGNDTARDSKRKKILEVAAGEFVKKGYQRANINRIAEMCGIGKGTIYLYFKSKEDLYVQALQESNDAWMKKANDIIESKGETLEALEELLKLDVVLGVRHKELAQLWITSFFGDNKRFAGTAASVLQEYYGLVERVVRSCVEQGVMRDIDPTLAAYILLGISELTIAFYDTLFKQRGEIEDIFPYIIDIIFNGLKSSGEDREGKPGDGRARKRAGETPAPAGKTR